MDHVQLYISWLNKVDVLTSCIPFSHEMTPTVKTNLIAGYFFSITHTFDKRKEYLWIFFYLGKYELCTTVHIMTQ